MRLHTQRQADGSYLWTLVRSDDDGTVIACAACGAPDVAGCVHAAQRIFDAPPQAVRPVREAGGGWRWAVQDEAGTTVATSAETYTCQAFCGYALYEIRHHASLDGHRLPVG